MYSTIPPKSGPSKKSPKRRAISSPIIAPSPAPVKAARPTVISPGHLLDGVHTRADDRAALNGEALVGQPVDCALGVRVALV